MMLGCHRLAVVSDWAGIAKVGLEVESGADRWNSSLKPADSSSHRSRLFNTQNACASPLHFHISLH